MRTKRNLVFNLPETDGQIIIPILGSDLDKTIGWINTLIINLLRRYNQDAPDSVTIVASFAGVNWKFKIKRSEIWRLLFLSQQ